MTRPEHLFVSDTDGALYDTRDPEWSKKPIRPTYSKPYLAYEYFHTPAEVLAMVKATLRHGPYVFPGGYALYFVTTDGEALSFDAVRENFQNVVWSTMNRVSDGWRLHGCGIIHDSEEEVICAHTGLAIV